MADTAQVKAAPAQRRLAVGLFAISRPAGWQDLLSFLLLLATLLVVVRSVEAANWVPMPSLTFTALAASVVSYASVRWTMPWGLGHVLGNLLGAFIIYFQTSLLVGDGFGAVSARFHQWWLDVIEQGASTDILPFGVLLAVLTWLASYFAIWVFFRHRNAWIVLLPTGLGLIANLSWLPRSFHIYLYGYLATGFMLVAYVTVLERLAALRKLGVNDTGSFLWRSLRYALVISGVVLLITFVLPAHGWTNFLVKQGSQRINQPIERLREQFTRAFAVPSRLPLSLRFFGPILPIHRLKPQGEEPIFAVRDRIPAYWRMRVYSDYTSTAWRVEDTRGSLVDLSRIQGAQDVDELVTLGSAFAVSVDTLTETPFIFVPGNLLSLSTPVTAEFYGPKKYQIDLNNQRDNDYLPADLRRLVDKVSGSTDPAQDVVDEATARGESFVVTQVVVNSPNKGRVTVNIDPAASSYIQNLEDALKSGSPVSLQVQRGGSPFFEVLSYKPKARFGEGRSYSFMTELTLPSEELLRATNQDYPQWITDRYMSLPKDLPSRVRVLAERITRDASTAYDKAGAIEEFLRQNYAYNLAVPPVPPNADVVDHFLFEGKIGYSDYFASAMAVMLRTLGIPTRVVLGYGPGNLDDDYKAIVVRDKDSHTWPEVFFPGSGWVEFEPSPIYRKRPRGRLEGLSTVEMPLPSVQLEEIQDEEIAALPEAEKKREEVAGKQPGGRGFFPPAIVYVGSPLGGDGIVFLLFIGLFGLTMWAVWTTSYVLLPSPEAAYLKLKRLAVFLGLKVPLSLTPNEFSRAMTRIVPTAREDISLICDSFVMSTYGKKRLSIRQKVGLLKAWRNARRKLVLQLVNEQHGEP